MSDDLQSRIGRLIRAAMDFGSEVGGPQDEMTLEAAENQLREKVAALEAENERLRQELLNSANNTVVAERGANDAIAQRDRALLALKEVTLVYGLQSTGRLLDEMWGENWRTEDHP